MSKPLDHEMYVINCVINFIDNHREKAIQALCGDAHEDYIAEWRARKDVQSFWGHMGLDWRRKLIQMALEFYAD